MSQLQKVKQNSRAAILLRSLMSGYTIRERYHELSQTYDLRRRNLDQRQANDREILNAQEQMIAYLKTSNHELHMRLVREGASDQIMVARVFSEEKPLRLELTRSLIDDVKGKVFDKYMDKQKALMLLQCLRRDQLKRLRKHFLDLEYMERLDRDREDVKVEKEIEDVETDIYRTRMNLETASYLRDKYREILYQMNEDAWHFDHKLDTIKQALNKNMVQLQDIRSTYVEAKTSSKKYTSVLKKVVRTTAKNRKDREEKMSSKLREQGMLRVEAVKARELRAANESNTTATIVTPAIALLEEKIKAAKVDILRYAETFQIMRQRTMVERDETVASIVTQEDIFDELRQRKANLLNRKAQLLTELEALTLERNKCKFVVQQSAIEAETAENQLKTELENLVKQIDSRQKELRTNAEIQHEISRGIQVLFAKLKPLDIKATSPEDAAFTSGSSVGTNVGQSSTTISFRVVDTSDPSSMSTSGCPVHGGSVGMTYSSTLSGSESNGVEHVTSEQIISNESVSLMESDVDLLTVCGLKLEALIHHLVVDPVYRDVMMKLCCSLFQEPLEECSNIPQPNLLMSAPSVEDMHFESSKGQVLTREEMKKRSEKLYQSKQKVPVQ